MKAHDNWRVDSMAVSVTLQLAALVSVVLALVTLAFSLVCVLVLIKDNKVLRVVTRH